MEGEKNKSEPQREKNDEVRLEHQTINSPLSLWVEEFGGGGGKADIWGGCGGMMRVYLKHSDPVAEGCLGAGMNKTLMAHKTQQPLIQASASQHLVLLGLPNHVAQISKHREERKTREECLGSFFLSFF